MFNQNETSLLEYFAYKTETRKNVFQLNLHDYQHIILKVEKVTAGKYRCVGPSMLQCLQLVGSEFSDNSVSESGNR